MNLSERILAAVKVVADKCGGYGLDFTVLFENSALFLEVVEALSFPMPAGVDSVAGIDAMGLPFASAIAARDGLPLFVVRHANNRIVGETVIGEESITEKSTMKFAVSPEIKGKSVLLIDDTISTGNSMTAAARAIEKAGGTVVARAVVIDMPANRKASLGQLTVKSLAALDAHSVLTH